MQEQKAQVSELADMMREFGLEEASLSLGSFSVRFARRASRPVASETEAAEYEPVHVYHAAPPVAPPEPKGTPVSSPMTGIYYASPNPSSPPFVREGDTVTAGQIVGLIEAMKVFSEIPCPISGTVLKAVAASGDLVQPGDVLLLIG